MHNLTRQNRPENIEANRKTSHGGQPLVAVSIDLDGLDLYHAIHGIEINPEEKNAVYEVALSRFLAIFETLSIPSTLFVVTRYLSRKQVVDQLQRACDMGHELASHTHSHPYNLSSLSSEEITEELVQAEAVLKACFGIKPTGFRTPGYNLNDRVLSCVAERGYRYDSSVFPCPPYYFAKAAVMAAMRIVGRKSGSTMTDPRNLLAPIKPYIPTRGRCFRPAKGDNGYPLWELPMCVLPWLGLPIIGTSLTLSPSIFRWGYPLLKRSQQYINLEFHGADLLGPGDPGVSDALLEKQPDLRRSVEKKTGIFTSVFEQIGENYKFVTLDTMAQALSKRF